VVNLQGNTWKQEERMIRATRAVLALAVVALAAAAVVAASMASPRQANTVVIGWAFDSKGAMAPFDGPALATAKDRVKQVNKGSGVDLQIKTCDTQGNKPAVAKACAAKLLGQGADVIFTTCDVDYAAPVVQEAINRGKLTIAPCIGTDQMGPKRFGAKGRLAFSFGNVAQDEGSAMAEYAWKRGWRNASLATDTVIVYFKNVVQAFKARWKQLGGKIVTEESYQSAGGSPASWQNVVTRLNAKKADVIVTSTAAAFGAQVPIINGLRTLGNSTPILNSWAGDGNYWYPKDPKVTNYFYVTFASAFGDDPVAAVNALARRNAAAIAKAGSTGGFVTGPAAIDGLLVALKRAGGSTEGAKLAAQMEKFKKVPTLSGLVSFSKTLHTVFGRQYRVIRVQNNTPKVVTTIKARVVPKI
jgi:branched-chain amino acid transport system substrate-binding protein